MRLAPLGRTGGNPAGGDTTRRPAKSGSLSATGLAPRRRRPRRGTSTMTGRPNARSAPSFVRSLGLTRSTTKTRKAPDQQTGSGGNGYPAEAVDRTQAPPLRRPRPASPPVAKRARTRDCRSGSAPEAARRPRCRAFRVLLAGPVRSWSGLVPSCSVSSVIWPSSVWRRLFVTANASACWLCARSSRTVTSARAKALAVSAASVAVPPVAVTEIVSESKSAVADTRSASSAGLSVD